MNHVYIARHQLWFQWNIWDIYPLAMTKCLRTGIDGFSSMIYGFTKLWFLQQTVKESQPEKPIGQTTGWAHIQLNHQRCWLHQENLGNDQKPCQRQTSGNYLGQEQNPELNIYKIVGSEVLNSTAATVPTDQPCLTGIFWHPSAHFSGIPVTAGSQRKLEATRG